jgi:putative phosphonate metabolism protein
MPTASCRPETSILALSHFRTENRIPLFLKMLGGANTVVAGPRFAIYFVPPAGAALYRFGAAVLGYDCYTGETIERLRDSGLTRAEWATLTAEPRRYGFHATLKAPFRLRPELDPEDLLAGVRALAAAMPTAPTLEPVVGLIGGFVAIVPATQSAALDQLAADCVTAFERFRLPLTAEEREKRMAAGLSPHQADHLDRFGYPYVFEEFRFHMSLTGRIGPDRRAAIHALLQSQFAKACGQGAIRLNRLALVRQDHPDASFRVIGHSAVGRPTLPG